VLDIASLFLDKAVRSLAGAESEIVNGRYDNGANRCYYACFQAAIVALLRAGIRPPGGGQWSHAFVPSQFEGELIGRRKLYPTELRNVLQRNYLLRRSADYEHDLVSQTQVGRALRRSRVFVDTIIAGPR
jgi:uncharacterized protein (UPF0332 family)